MKIKTYFAATLITLSMAQYSPAYASKAQVLSEFPQTSVDFLAPRIARIMPEASANNKWHYSLQPGTPESQNTCAAFYSSQSGVVAIADTRQLGTGATLSFWGPNIPSPNSPRMIPVILSQTDEQPKTVHVFNSSLSDGQGVLIFLSPSIDAALEGMWPDHHFNISMEGHTLIDITWHQGNEAKDALRRCVEAG